MKLREALTLIQQQPVSAPPRRFLLACSTVPVSLKPFLHAFLIQNSPGCRIEVETTGYGDLAAEVEHAHGTDLSGAALFCEWFDLDARLGYRRLGGWLPSAHPDLCSGVESSIERLQAAIQRLSGSAPVSICLPTLPLPPVSYTVPEQASTIEIRLEQAVARFAEWCVGQPRVRVVSRLELDRISPPDQRFAFLNELTHGSPYTTLHAEALARLSARLLVSPPPLKGLITDLDDTLWRGILGEVGVANVCFTLDTGAQIHGLYQQFLRSLAERGVLLAAASKNDPALAAEALARTDMILGRDHLFPVEAHWGPKSESVGRILSVWNIGADAVAFVDDSPLELAQVSDSFPGIRTLQFPASDPNRFPEFLHTLRGWFGRPAILEEDRIRSASIRTGAEFGADAHRAAADEETFLSGLQSAISFERVGPEGDPRAFELINKTNQFNSNGRRLSESEWIALLRDPACIVLTVSYTDRFGPLGKVGVVVLRTEDGTPARIDTWVLSCRAFSRRVEFATLRYMFDTLGVSELFLDYLETPRNGPFRAMLERLQISPATLILSRTDFERYCPPLWYS